MIASRIVTVQAWGVFFQCFFSKSSSSSGRRVNASALRQNVQASLRGTLWWSSSKDSLTRATIKINILSKPPTVFSDSSIAMILKKTTLCHLPYGTVRLSSVCLSVHSFVIGKLLERHARKLFDWFYFVFDYREQGVPLEKKNKNNGVWSKKKTRAHTHTHRKKTYTNMVWTKTQRRMMRVCSSVALTDDVWLLLLVPIAWKHVACFGCKRCNYWAS